MTASGQNHFPYLNDRYDKYDVKTTSNFFTKEDTEKIGVYAQGVYDADKSLNYLYTQIKKLKTPTIIVFFGDHLPIVNNDKSKAVYLASKYFHTKDENINELRQHTTKAVILANYNIKTEKIKYLNSNYLGAYVLNNMNLNVSDYFKYVNYVRTKVPVFSREYIYDNKNTKAITLNKASREEKAIIKDFRMVEQYSFYGVKKSS